ncbi:MAG: hypothetical protein ACRC33_05140, partial [Gemmataceae bacterium]
MSQPDPASRCQVAFGGHTTRFDGELTRLLRRRLVLVTALAIVPGALFFLRDLVEPPHAPAAPAGLVLRGALVL